MLKTYWRVVFRPHLSLILLIAGLTFISSLAEVASIGMIVPLAQMMIEPEQAVDNPITDLHLVAEC